MTTGGKRWRYEISAIASASPRPPDHGILPATDSRGRRNAADNSTRSSQPTSQISRPSRSMASASQRQLFRPLRRERQSTGAPPDDESVAGRRRDPLPAS